MIVKDTIERFESKEMLNEEKYSDEKIRSAVSNIEKNVEVGKDGRYKKIGKIRGEQYSQKVQGSKKSYSELADRATTIRKGLLLGAYVGRTPEDKKKGVSSRLNQLRNIIKKMEFHAGIVKKASEEASKKEHEVAVEKLRKPIKAKVAKEEREKAEAKRQKKGAKVERKRQWEKRVKDHLNKSNGALTGF